MTRRFLVTLLFVTFAVFLLLSNDYDWDQFQTTFEVDRRAWVLDGSPPLWSYQFCGGSTRIGDPQSFGISPLFIIPLLVGSLLGTKLLVLLGALIGYYFLRRLLLLVSSAQNEGQRNLASGLSAAFILSNFFLWHFHVGHVAFMPIYLSIALIYYFALGAKQKLKRSEFLMATFLTWSIFSGGFYGAALYFLFPVTLSFLIFVLVTRQFRQTFNTLKNTFSFFGLGLLLSSYKIYHVIKYQLENPRTLGAATPDFESLADFIGFQIIPTFNFQFLGDFEPTFQWKIWEYSNFSVVFLFSFLALMLVLNISVKPNVSKKLWLLLVIYFIISVGLALGSIDPAMPFSILNKYFLHDSARAPIRFQLNISFALTMASFFILKSWNANKIKITNLIMLCLCLLNILSFSRSLSWNSFMSLFQLPATHNGEMKIVHLAPFNQRMYPFVRAGEGVLSCYQPLAREVRFTLENQTESLAAPFVESESISCRDSFYRQNRLQLAPSCAVGTCVNLNSLNAVDREYFALNPNNKKYCLIKAFHPLEE